MKKNKIFTLIMMSIICISVVFSTNVYAANDGLGWWDDATSWYSGGSTDVSLSDNVLSGIANMVEIVGTAVIAIATVVIGIKYMLGTVQGKTEAKENMVTLLVACLFFFGWANIRDLLITGNATGKGGLTGDTGLIFFNGNLENTFASIFTLLVVVGKFIAVAAILFMGVKYIFAGADAKAQLKEKSPAMIIGVILIFCTLTVLGLISNTINSIV